MKTLTVAGVLFLALMTPQGQGHGSLQLRLTTELPERLPHLYDDRELTLVNGASKTVLLPENAVRVRTFIEHDGGWVECRPRVLADQMPLGEIDWREIHPGESISLPMPANRCLCQGKRSRTCREWTARPGTHRLKAVLETNVHGAEVPAGGFDGAIESNVMEIQIVHPSGVDADAVAWAKGPPLGPEVLREFPTSTYAAFHIYRQFAKIRDVEPAAVQDLIDRGRYPGPNSVPSEEGGWQSLDSEGVARWQIDWGQRIFREHPDFPFRDDIRVAVALAQIASGDRQDARQSIEAVVNTGNPSVARWSRDFLALRPEQKWTWLTPWCQSCRGIFEALTYPESSSTFVRGIRQ